MEKRKNLVLFSGGKDSFLSACRIIEAGKKAALITYDNGCSLKSENAQHGADRIIKRYGKDSAEFLGVVDISRIWRNFLLLSKNMEPSEISKKFGAVTQSQSDCLTCRTSMYIDSIIRCKQKGIDMVVDGARESQGFVLELPPMKKRFKKMFKEYGIDWQTPVFDMKSDWELKNELMACGFVPKMLEPQCLIGVPLVQNPPPDRVIQGTVKFFDDFVSPQIPQIIKMNKNRPLVNKLEMDFV